jgi:hypothetical protein
MSKKRTQSYRISIIRFFSWYPLSNEGKRTAKRAKKKCGPKPKYLDTGCPNPKCKHHGKKGLDNVASNETYRTRRTGKPGSFYAAPVAKLSPAVPEPPSSTCEAPRRKSLRDFRCWPKGWGFGGPSSVLEIKLDTIRRWLAVAAAHREQISDQLLRDLKLSQVQVDELWTFVKKTPRSPWTDNPRAPLLAQEGRGRSLVTSWI